MTVFPKPERIDAFDGELSRRVDPQEWARISAMRDHPRFLHGVLQYAQVIPAYFAGKLVLNKVVTEVWRFHTLAFALHLHDIRDPGDPRTGLTITRLQRICQEQKIASAGRVIALVGLMQLGGYLKRVPSVADSRIILLVPTEKLVATVRGWGQAMMSAIDSIEPGAGFEQRHLADPGFDTRLRRAGMDIMLAGWRLVDPWHEVMHFVARDAAWMLLLRLIDPVIRAGIGGEPVIVSLDLAEFGKKFGVSRSHMRRVLDTAFEQGLLAAPPRNGSHIVMSHRLICSYLVTLASELDIFRFSARAASRAPLPRPGAALQS